MDVEEPPGLSVLFAGWPDEDELVGELWLGDVHVGHVRRRVSGLVVDLWRAEGIPLAHLEAALARIRERLGDD